RFRWRHDAPARAAGSAPRGDGRRGVRGVPGGVVALRLQGLAPIRDRHEDVHRAARAAVMSTSDDYPPAVTPGQARGDEEETSVRGWWLGGLHVGRSVKGTTASPQNEKGR